ncbi:hypothetical protein [Frankia sp. CcI49]|uniref:hypothetical protein n=1 Tax=Frankia sp. CcI49 TaxID=1745382 RepID=UPI001055146D|nr:hypothetical protein [Frankia sp. CcI49]
MRDQPDVSSDSIATAMQEMILEDIRDGRVPQTVDAFEQLHDFVDANDYVQQALEALGLTALPDDAARDNAAIALVDTWLAGGSSRCRGRAPVLDLARVVVIARARLPGPLAGPPVGAAHRGLRGAEPRTHTCPVAPYRMPAIGRRPVARRHALTSLPTPAARWKEAACRRKP